MSERGHYAVARLRRGRNTAAKLGGNDEDISFHNGIARYVWDRGARRGSKLSVVQEGIWHKLRFFDPCAVSGVDHWRHRSMLSEPVVCAAETDCGGAAQETEALEGRLRWRHLPAAIVSWLAQILILCVTDLSLTSTGLRAITSTIHAWRDTDGPRCKQGGPGHTPGLAGVSLSTCTAAKLLMAWRNDKSTA